ncbi:AAA family ATPase [Allorhizocola rhizosphaerae]|uniref:AAA family ATPase n=1 Tax=Allorhizocola rhizosphaerae TaxID=1872709 RepID=UPI0013C35D42|nr:AAA family ATPase [Allorhizocola rhizosphaerae]
MIASLTLRAQRMRCAEGPVLVAVIGPPGAGKSTVVSHLTKPGGVPVFRLREMIRSHPQLLADFAPSPDPLGWVGLQAVWRVLHAAFVDGLFDVGRGPVVLDNFPGTAGQLELLAEIADAVGAQVALLELRASATTLVLRVAQRRVCLACSPDSHAPAVASETDSKRCASCGATLSRRFSDVPRLHGLRLARYSANLPEITELAAERGIPHQRVDADLAMPDVLAAAKRAFSLLSACASTDSTDPFGADRDRRRLADADAAP